LDYWIHVDFISDVILSEAKNPATSEAKDGSSNIGVVDSFGIDSNSMKREVATQHDSAV